MGVVLMLELGQCYRVPPSPNCYQVTPVHYGSAADVNKKDTQDEESLKTRYYSEFKVQGWKNARTLQTATRFSSDESWGVDFQMLAQHNSTKRCQTAAEGLKKCFQSMCS